MVRNGIPESVAFAGYGWQPADWGQNYYPSGMPAEWRLAYYANHFSHLYIPAGSLPADGSVITSWREELGETLQLYFEANSAVLQAPNWPELAGIMLAFGATAVCLEPDLVLPPQPCFQRADRLLPDKPLLQGLWAPAADNRQLAILRSTPVPTPLELRRWFEQVQSGVASSALVIVVDAPYQTLEKVRQMAELYGWP